MVEAYNKAGVEPRAAASVPAEPVRWQQVLRDAVRSASELAALLDLPESAIRERIDMAPAFPVLVPRGYLARMRRGDARDPLLRQVLPDLAETVATPGYVADPLEEGRFAEHGVVRKYAGRVLLIATGACPIHCRYCFRREFPYAEQLAARGDWRASLAALGADPTVEEVILSGGDPLSLPSSRLAQLIGRLDAIPHLERLRIHTRFPIVIPERVDAALLRLLDATRLGTTIVLHANHPNELRDAAVGRALAALADNTTALLNQSVLLAGVNDDTSTLAELCRLLFDAGVLPYYLHLPDRVSGTAHFDVTAARATELIDALRTELPGYLVPRLVREQPGALSKTVLA